MDMNGDGVITAKDYELMADRWIEAGQLGEDDSRELRAGLNKVYRRSVHPDGHDTSFENALMQAKTCSKNEMCALNTPYFAKFFPIMDTNNDGFIDEKEFSVFFKVMRSDDEAARNTFKRLDTNHDGKISKEEFMAAGNNFFTLEEEGDASDEMWGPLVVYD